MKPYYADDAVTLHHGDCLEVLRTLPDASVDAAVTDPPYALEFMGKDWDSFGDTRQPGDPTFTGADNPYGRSKVRHGATAAYRSGNEAMRAFGAWCQQWAAECLRVLKPGGYLLAFGGPRTVHRLTTGIEDAGFEIRDGIDWIFGSGFPKSRNIGEGRGTALKPAREPIVMARKPLAGTVAGNVTAHGTGALNIDACRIPTTDRLGGGAESATNAGKIHEGWQRPWMNDASASEAYASRKRASVARSEALGRWPSNVVLSHGDCGEQCAPGCPVAELDRQSGVLTSGANPARRGSDKFRDAYGDFKGQAECQPARGADSGGASRFFPVFRYEAKAPTAERPRTPDGTAHPTVKPLDLMRWLVRLVTPPGGVVLEPFAGSGTTAEACVLEGFRCIAIERDETYLPLITARLTKPLQPALDMFGAA